jgi:branched-chain amino acid transport system permease protein
MTDLRILESKDQLSGSFWTTFMRSQALPMVLLRAGLQAFFVMLGLCIPVVLFRMDQNASNELIVYSRWGLVLTFCISAVLIRLMVVLLSRRKASSKRNPSLAAAESPFSIGHLFERGWNAVSANAPLFLLGIGLTFPLLMILMTGSLSQSRYWVDLATLIITYIILGWGLNIAVGLAGLLDLGYAAFYAVGAYTYALLSTTFDLSFWVCLPLAGCLAALWGLFVGFPVLRLRGDYLAIVTLAFGEIVRLVLINWDDLTNGGAGIASIPRITFFGIPFSNTEDGFAQTFGLSFDPMHRILFLYYVALGLALITSLVTLRLRRLPIGRAWEAMREDEIACRSLGINTRNTKLTAFSIGAAFGGLAGAFFAVRQGFVSPESFAFVESATVLAIVVFGGMGSQVGVVIAAILLVGLPELLRHLDVLKPYLGRNFDPNEYRLLLFGLAMVMMMLWRPRGLVSHRDPSVVLDEEEQKIPSPATIKRVA